MHLVFVDEFGCNRIYDKEALSDYGYHPTRGYAGIIVPAQSFVSFYSDFIVLKIIALRQFDRILRDSTKSIRTLRQIDPRFMDPHVSPEACRRILEGPGQLALEARDAIVRAEIKSSDLLRRGSKLIQVRRRFINLLLKCLSAHGCSIYYTGYEKRTQTLSPKILGEYEYSLKEIDYLIEVLRRVAIRSGFSFKLLFDQHTIDERRANPLARKREFDRIIQSRNYGRWFPETATVDVESRYSLGMQAADWMCGMVSRYLALEVEPNARAEYGTLFQSGVKDTWSHVLTPDSMLRHGRGAAFTSKLVMSAAQYELPLSQPHRAN